MLPPIKSSTELIARCVAGEQEARARFYGEFVDIVRRAVLRTLQRYDADGSVIAETEDLVSEVFTKLFADDCAMLAQLREGVSLYAWLISVTRNHVIDHLRRTTLRGRVTSEVLRETGSATVPSHRAAAVLSEQSDAVRSAVDKLDPGDRLALELYFVQGLTYAQIADILHSNVNTVSSRIRRAKVKLRRVLEARGIFEP